MECGIPRAKARCYSEFIPRAEARCYSGFDIGEFEEWGEVAGVRVDGEVFHEGILYPTHVAALLLHAWTTHGFGGVCMRGAELEGEVGGGDLEAVEEEAGAFGVELVAGDASEDVAEGDLDGGGVIDGGDGEGETIAAACGGGAEVARAAVVVAEVLSAQGGRAALAALGEDVAALIAARRVGHLSEFVWQHWRFLRGDGVPRTPVLWS
jgi:hypothetical protein